MTERDPPSFAERRSFWCQHLAAVLHSPRRIVCFPRVTIISLTISNHDYLTSFVWAMTTTILNRSILRLGQAEQEDEAYNGLRSPIMTRTTRISVSSATMNAGVGELDRLRGT